MLHVKKCLHGVTRDVYAQAHGTSEHITLLCGCSAAGIALPPMIIISKSFPGGSYRSMGQMMQSMPKATLGGLSWNCF